MEVKESNCFYNSFIQNDGLPEFGHLNAIPKGLQLDAFHYTNEMDRPVSKWRKHFAYKQFQFVSVTTPDYVIGVAIADIRYLASGFCYVFDIKRNELMQQQWLRPLNIGYSTQPSSWSSLAQLANHTVQFSVHESHWRIKVSTELLKADIQLMPSKNSLPLMLCTPTGYSGWTYTQKHNALGIKGELFVNGVPQNISLATGGYDFSAGYMRRETSWRWASINHISNERKIGLNLAAGVNETGFCENVFWVDGERHLLPPVAFQFSRQASNASWQIKSQDLRVKLTFSPLNQRSEKKNLWFLKSNFRQYIGHFSGYIIDDHGKKHHLDRVVGLTEDHYAKW